MAQAWKRWFVRVGGLALVACTDSFVPPLPYPQVPVRLAFAGQPGAATAGAALSPSVTVVIEDSSGDTVPTATSVVSLSFDRNPGAGTLTGTVSVAAVAGVATFSNLHIDKAAIGYSLQATAPGLIAATSALFPVAAGATRRLEFMVQPSNAMGGVIIAPPVQVAARDSFGNATAGFTGVVTVALVGTPPPGTLSGTTAVTAVNGVATFPDLSIAEASAGYTLTASAAGLTSTSSAPFAVSPPAAALYVTTATGGSALDPSGYDVCVDPTPLGSGGFSCTTVHAVAVNGALTVAVDTGAHTVLLMGVAANCTVAGDNPRAVHVAQTQTAAVPFSVTCASGSLHVTTTTSGVSIPSYGYVVCIDSSYYGCDTYSPISLDSAVTLSVALGTHVVELEGVAANCTVGGDNPRTVDVGAITDLSFAITCVAAGTVRVTTTTSGTDVPYGYSVCIDPSGSACSMSAYPPANSVVNLSGVTAGPHTVTLTTAASNCTATGPTARAVTVPQDGTVDVAFDVACVVAERVAFSYYGTLTSMRVDGLETHGIVPGISPAWSPDGTRLAYECGRDICAINADSTAFAQLTSDGAENHHPTWSPDGSRIAFAATHASSVPSVFVTDLYVMAATGAGIVRLTNDIGVVGNPAWSPDGTTIAFDCRVAGNDDICSVHPDGSGFARLTNDSARDYGAAWKPDGSTLAFATTRYGPDEIVLMSSTGGSVTRIGAGLPGFAPTWSPDGSQIAYTQHTENCDYYYGCYSNDYVYVASVDGSGARYLSAGNQAAWKPHP